MTAKPISLKKILSFISLFIIIVFVLLALMPLSKASLENCATHTGIVADVTKGGGKGDIIIHLKNDKNYYYINRGTESGLSISILKEQLVNKDAELLTIKHWTPVDPTSRTKHIAKVTVDSIVLYSEIQ
ncbi:MAG: hypothetical protein IPK31_01845 [Chitinophagaceae bacterium]|nr:hypothetical protein [Chitinophagaceae bacterium]